MLGRQTEEEEVKRPEEINREAGLNSRKYEFFLGWVKNSRADFLYQILLTVRWERIIEFNNMEANGGLDKKFPWGSVGKSWLNWSKRE